MFNFPPGAQAMPIPSQSTGYTDTLGANFSLLLIIYTKATQLMGYFGLVAATPAPDTPHHLSKTEKARLRRNKKEATASKTAIEQADNALLYGRDYLENPTQEFYNTVDNFNIAVNRVVQQGEAIFDDLNEIERAWGLIQSSNATLHPVIMGGLECQKRLEKKKFQGDGCMYDSENKIWKPVESGYFTRENLPPSKTGVFAYIDVQRPAPKLTGR